MSTHTHLKTVPGQASAKREGINQNKNRMARPAEWGPQLQSPSPEMDTIHTDEFSSPKRRHPRKHLSCLDWEGLPENKLICDTGRLDRNVL